MPPRDRPTLRRRPPAPARQRGAALILLLTVLVLGVVWYTVGALGKAAPTTAEREAITGRALEQAKQALLAYVAQYAARSSTIEPGQMPCPESLNAIGTSNQGQAAPNCALPKAGRLPWETLGIDEIRDGYGQPIWYVLSPGFRAAPINFGTPGHLTYRGNPNAAVALLIAPGPALNTLSDPGSPPAGCSKVDQQVSARNTAPLDPANFLECDNYSGNNTIVGNSPWTNDRVLAITQAEWARAIAGPVADRLQRQVAPRLEQWRTTDSLANWGRSYLPYASTFGVPSSNSLCGSNGTSEGLPPTATVASGTCSTSWTSGSITPILGPLFGTSCTPGAAYLQCTFSGFYFGFGSPLLQVNISATAPRIASSFRDALAVGDITITPAAGTTITGFSNSLSPSTGDATLSFDISKSLGLGISTFTVTIPNVPDATMLSDASVSWYFTNDWARYTYYGISPAATVNPGTNTCPAGGGAQCLTLSGLPAANGASNDKQIILTLMGPGPVGAQTQPNIDPAQYLESHTSGSSVYAAATVTSSFNDRLAACPFQQTPASGGPVAICN